MVFVRMVMFFFFLKKEESCGQSCMGNVELYFVNQVFLLLGFLEVLIVYVYCEVLSVFDYKIFFVLESLKRFLCYGLYFKENYLLLLFDYYQDSIFLLEIVI